MTKNWLVAYCSYESPGDNTSAELRIDSEILYSLDFPSEKLCKQRFGNDKTILSITEVPDGWRQE
jgi:hypothetical protein